MGRLWDEFKEQYTHDTDRTPRFLTLDDTKSITDKPLAQPPRNREQIAANIRLANPARWHRLQKDLRWLERQMIKRGLSPEDARWIL